MLYKKTIWVLVVTAFMLIVPMAHSADLTNRQIEGYIATLEELNVMEDESTMFDDDDYTFHEFKDGLPKMSVLIERSKGHPDYAKFVAVIKRHGFSNENEWAEVADRVNAATMYLMMDESDDEVMRELENARREIENIPGLSDAQKEQMLAIATGSIQLIKFWVGDVPEADLKAVKPYLQKLMAAMDPDES